MKEPFLSTKFSESGKRAKKRFDNILNPTAKRRGAVFLMCIIVLVGIVNLLVNFKGSEEMHLAVLTEDSDIFFDSSLSAYAASLLENDLFYVFFEADDTAYVRLLDGNYPQIEGYLPQKLLSYDFDRANQVLITSDNVYQSPDESTLIADVSAKNLICNVVEYNNPEGWVMVIRPGDTERLWIKSSDISYNISLDSSEQLSGGFYRQIKSYLQEEYTKTYKPYYDATRIEQLSGYTESYDDKTKTLEAKFTMRAGYRNYYKDPDTVKYIQDAKKMAELKGDEYYQKLYNTYYNEYNQIKVGNYVLKLTATVSGGKLNMDSIKLYNNIAGKGEEWQELENGFNDFIID